MDWPRRPVTTTGRDGRAPPEQFAGDHRRTKRSAPSPKEQPSTPAGLPPSQHRRPRSSAPPQLPCPPTPAWANSDSQKATYPPGARCPAPSTEGARRRRRKTRRRSHRFRWSLRLSRNPPKAPSSRRRRPAGRGHSGRPGRGGRDMGRVGRPPDAGLLLVPRRKVRNTRRWSHIRLSAPSCRRRACPAPLSPSAWAARGALRVGPAPRPRRPPRPPRLRPPPSRGGGGGIRAWRAQRGDRDRTWSACWPRPGPNQASRGGVSRVRVR